MSTVEELLTNHQQIIEDLRLIPGGSGIFDVRVNEELIYSKHETGRHTEKGEIAEKFEKIILSKN